MLGVTNGPSKTQFSQFSWVSQPHFSLSFYTKPHYCTGVLFPLALHWHCHRRLKAHGGTQLKLWFQPPLVSDHLSSVTSFPKYQKFPRQIIILILEPLVTEHLSHARATTFRAESLNFFPVFNSL